MSRPAPSPRSSSARESLRHDSSLRLEFPEFLELLARYADSPWGRLAVSELRPRVDLEALRGELDEVEEVRLLLRDRVAFRLAEGCDPRPWLAETGVTRVLEPKELFGVLRLLSRHRELGELLSARTDLPRLAPWARGWTDLPELRTRLEASVGPGDEVLTDASPELRRLREETRREEEGIRQWMERARQQKTYRSALQGDVITLRHDRFVFAVRAEQRHKVRGVVHGESASGATLFIEPEGIVLRGNRLADMRAQERREVARILAELTASLRREREAVLAAFGHLVHLEVTLAKARFAEAFGAHPAELGEGRRLVLTEARHPLLMWRDRVEGPSPREIGLETVRERVVPLRLELDGKRFQMVVTGPNTGGKTVVLKTLGLLTLMTYCGTPIPAGEESSIPLFDGVLADIGDEQSLQQDLSTFSSHMTVIGRILDQATTRSLVLLDELGAGTDPLEGAALAEAILDVLYERGTFSVVTTHLGRLKEYAFRRRKCVNASMEFDVRRLAPTYRLRAGLPGESNALIIARRIGVPESVVSRSEKLLAGEERLDPGVLEGMERARRNLEREEREMARRRENAERLERDRAEEVKALRSLQSAIEHEAEQSESERVQSVVDRVVAALRELGEPPADRREPYDRLLAYLEEASQGTALARRRREKALGLKKGDSVFIPRFRSVCEVKKINKSKEILTVSLGGIPSEVSFQEISWVLPPPGYELEWYAE